MVIEMISDQVLKLIGDQFNRPSNVHGKTRPKTMPIYQQCRWTLMQYHKTSHSPLKHSQTRTY